MVGHDAYSLCSIARKLSAQDSSLSGPDAKDPQHGWRIASLRKFVQMFTRNDSWSNVHVKSQLSTIKPQILQPETAGWSFEAFQNAYVYNCYQQMACLRRAVAETCYTKNWKALRNAVWGTALLFIDRFAENIREIDALFEKEAV